MVTVDETLATAVRHHQAGELVEAEKVYRQVLQIEPRNAHALGMLGTLAIQAGQMGVAVRLIGEAINEDGSQAGFHANLAEAYRHLNQYDEAIRCGRRALELQPQLLSAHLTLGMIYYQQKDLTAAAESFRDALRVDPDNAQGCGGLGRVLLDQGNLSEAHVYFRCALQTAPNDPIAYANMASVLQARQARRSLRVLPHAAVAGPRKRDDLQ